jgi:hypothetical protein
LSGSFLTRETKAIALRIPERASGLVIETARLRFVVSGRSHTTVLEIEQSASAAFPRRHAGLSQIPHPHHRVTGLSQKLLPFRAIPEVCSHEARRAAPTTPLMEPPSVFVRSRPRSGSGDWPFAP